MPKNVLLFMSFTEVTELTKQAFENLESEKNMFFLHPVPEEVCFNHYRSNLILRRLLAG